MRRYIGVVIAALVFGIGILMRSQLSRSWQLNEAHERAERSLPKNFSMHEESAERGISFQYKGPELAEALQPEDLHVIGGGIAVADINGDGWQDFYVTTAGLNQPNHLYLNQGGRAFTEASEQWRVRDLNLTLTTLSANPIVQPEQRSFASIFPLFFDYNRDGKPDLLVVGIGCSKLFENLGDVFQDVSEESGLADCRNAQTAVPLDYNRDGFTDLYIVRYFGPQDLFTTDDANVWINSSFNATNGGSNTLYRNNGDGTFSDVTKEIGGGDAQWSFDAAAGDFFDDGGTEILVSNDFGPDKLYSVAPDTMADISDRLGTPDRRLGMGVSVGYLDSSGRPFVHVSNAYHPQYRHEGNFLWQFGLDGVGRDRALSWGSNYCLWAWGSNFQDFDLDGTLDLFIANGFLSGADRKEVAPGIYIEPESPPKDASFRMGTLQTFPGRILESGTVFGAMFRDDAEAGRLSFAGYQQDCMFLNKEGSFSDVASVAGMDEDADGRAVASIDFDNDGAVDLLVTTRNQGLKLYHNRVVPNSRWIGFELVDATGNELAPGARIRVSQGERVWYRYAAGGKSGFLAMSDPRLHIGLQADSPVDIEVRWPSGNVESTNAVAPGKYYRLCEGQPDLRCMSR